jgi:hypothetical protein
MSSTSADSFLNRLLSGPDNAELSARDLALLEAYLQQPVTFATIQREKKTTGHSPTEAARNKLKLIRDFNRGLQRQATRTKRGASKPLRRPTRPRSEVRSAALAGRSSLRP